MIYRRCYIAIFLCLIFSQNSFAHTVNGRVTTAISKKAIVGAVVFIHNTQKYTTTDSTGKFSIENVGEVFFDLIVTHPGFEKLIYRYTAENIGKTVIVELGDAVVDSTLQQPESLVKSNLSKWSGAFMSNFIGMSEYADCEVLNPEVLRFFYNGQKNSLVIKATDRLQIVNETLGYLMVIYLDDFVIEGNIISYDRQMFFKPLHSKNMATIEKWHNNREKVYKGSLLHFMRSVYSNTLEREGFGIKKIVRIYDSEPLFQKYAKSDEVNQAKTLFVNDSLNSSGRYVDVIMKTSIDDFRKKDAVNQTIFFVSKDPLVVTYKNAYLSYDYLRTIGFKSYATSYITSVENNQIRIEPDGSFFESSNLFVDGYWAWLKTASKLPWDYNANQ